jgi:hypothetical protein
MPFSPDRRTLDWLPPAACRVAKTGPAKVYRTRRARVATMASDAHIEEEMRRRWEC